MEKIKQLTLEHVDVVVDIHLESFKGFFTSFLGREFLSLEYSELVKSPLCMRNDNARSVFQFIHEKKLVEIVLDIFKKDYQAAKNNP